MPGDCKASVGYNLAAMVSMFISCDCVTYQWWDSCIKCYVHAECNRPALVEVSRKLMLYPHNRVNLGMKFTLEAAIDGRCVVLSVSGNVEWRDLNYENKFDLDNCLFCDWYFYERIREVQICLLKYDWLDFFVRGCCLSVGNVSVIM